MKSHRPVFRLFKNRFSRTFSEVFPFNAQPRTPSLGRKFYLGAAAILACLLSSNASAGTLTATPANVTFGSVALGTKNSQALLLKNTGSSSLTVSGAQIFGLGFSMSSVSAPRTLAPGQAITLTVAFAPVLTGYAPGTINFISNATNPTLTVPLTGSGV